MADSQDDFTKYEVTSRTEVLSILKGMLEQGSLITFYFNQGYDFLLTSLLEIASDGKTMIFDYGSNMEMNRKLLQTNKIKCVSTKEKVRIEFTLMGVDAVRHEGREAFEGDVPESLIRLQRREFYRLSAPKVNPIKVNIPLPQEDGSITTLQAVVVDISGSGVSLDLAKDNLSLKEGGQFTGVTINLPNVGIITAEMRVRSIYDVTMANGKVLQRAGCEFIKLPGAMSTLIQRYIIAVERERKSREI